MLVHLENIRDAGEKGKAMTSGMLGLHDNVLWITPYSYSNPVLCVFPSVRSLQVSKQYVHKHILSNEQLQNVHIDLSKYN